MVNNKEILSKNDPVNKSRHKAGEGFSIPSLDGIRALSVLIVVISHAGYGKIIPGGLGVTIFFFLSGYLITTLLLNEYSASGHINIGHFYIRRFLRLTPPLIITLIISYLLTYYGVLSGGISKTGFFAQLFYFANYYNLFFNHDHNIPHGTEVLWSLAVEEHFYIFYPFLLSKLLPRFRLKSIGILFIFICGIVLTWRFVLTSPADFNINRIYFATDTRIDSILYGCILAVLFNPMQNAKPRAISKRLGWSLIAVGGLIIIFSLIYRNVQFRESLRYTLQGIALMPIFYCAITMSNSYFYKLLNWAVIKRIGVYSYVIYLSHHVIVHLLEEHLSFAQSKPYLLGMTLILSTAFAAFVDKAIDPYFKRLRKAYR